jgi:ribosomal protein S18 acetylase RimI-like enzyme
MHIRPYNSRDRERIRGILAGSGTFTEEEVAVALEVIDDAQKYPESDDYTILCADGGDGCVVGYICFGPIPMTDRCFDLYWICVDGDKKRSGIGSSLVRAMEADLADRNVRHIYIDTSSTTPYTEARRFYERHGYCVASVYPDFYREGDDRIVYIKKL